MASTTGLTYLAAKAVAGMAGIKKPCALFALAVGLVLPALPAHAHWCNSGARLTNIEQAICGDACLVSKDIELIRLYSLAGAGTAV